MSSLNLTLRPLQAEYIAKPGATLIQAYEITNNSEDSIYLTSSVEPWQPSGTDGSVTYTDVSPNPHIQFSLNNADLKLGDTFRLAPSEHRQLVLKIKTDSEATLSDSYYTFFVNKLPANTQSDTTNAQVLAKVGSHLLLSTSTTENTPLQANISKFTTTPLVKDVLFTPLSFNATIDNKADYFFKTFGQLKVTKNNRLIKTLDLDPLNVLAHHSRSISPVTLNPPFWPGAYTATLTLDASASGKSASVNFFVFPFSPLILFLIIGSILLLIRRHPTKKV